MTGFVDFKSMFSRHTVLTFWAAVAHWLVWTVLNRPFFDCLSPRSNLVCGSPELALLRPHSMWWSSKTTYFTRDSLFWSFSDVSAGLYRVCSSWSLFGTFLLDSLRLFDFACCFVPSYITWEQNLPLNWCIFLPDVCQLRSRCSFTFLNVKTFFH